MTEHPITPSSELEEQWLNMWPQDALTAAARWGADQELEACCELILRMRPDGGRAWTPEQAACFDALTAAAEQIREHRRTATVRIQEL